MYEHAQKENYQGNALAAANAIQPPKPSVTAEIINRLDSTGSLLCDVLHSQRALIERLHGPRPQSESNGAGKLSQGGALGSIDERLTNIAQYAKEIVDNQNQLERLA